MEDTTLLDGVFLLNVAKDFVEEKDCYDLAICLLFEGKSFITSQGPIRHTCMTANDILTRWKRQQGSAASPRKLMDTLINMGMHSTAEDHSLELGVPQLHGQFFLQCMPGL